MVVDNDNFGVRACAVLVVVVQWSTYLAFYFDVPGPNRPEVYYFSVVQWSTYLAFYSDVPGANRPEVYYFSVVRWSTYSPSSLKTRVQIDLKSTIFGGPVVNNVLDFYSERPSSNSAEVVNFSILKNFVERAKNKRKKRLGWPLK